MNVFQQAGHDVRLEWGAEGIAALGTGCAVLVVVDVLSFSTRVDLALADGHRVRPLHWLDEDLPEGSAVPLRSPNGATLSAEAAAAGAHVLTACLRNAEAVAAAARALAGNAPVGVVPCGERWGVHLHAAPGATGPLRPCVEDHLGAGAVVAALLGLGARRPSPEASLTALAWWAAAGSGAGALVADSASGRELRENGHADLVGHAVAVGSSRVVPRLTDRVYERA